MLSPLDPNQEGWEGGGVHRTETLATATLRDLSVTQSFSTCALLTVLTNNSVAGGSPVPCRVFTRIPGLHALDAQSNFSQLWQKCLQCRDSYLCPRGQVRFATAMRENIRPSTYSYLMIKNTEFKFD